VHSADVPGTCHIVHTGPLVQSPSTISKKPRQRREAPGRADNDNRPGDKPVVRFAWDVYRAAARSRWVGQVIAADATEAIEAAAVEFRADVWKLIAVRRWEVA
jgi:hypothetical protein